MASGRSSEWGGSILETHYSPLRLLALLVNGKKPSVAQVNSTKQREVSEMEKMLLTPEEVAEMLGIGRSTVYNLIGEHLLRSFKIGRSRRVLVSDVQEYVDNLATSSIGQ